MIVHVSAWVPYKGQQLTTFDTALGHHSAYVAAQLIVNRILNRYHRAGYPEVQARHLKQVRVMHEWVISDEQ